MARDLATLRQLLSKPMSEADVPFLVSSISNLLDVIEELEARLELSGSSYVALVELAARLEAREARRER